MKRTNFFVYFFVLLFYITACNKNGNKLSLLGENLEADIRVLSSDEFEGRAPATPGGEKARNYIAHRFAQIGLLPTYGDSFFQSVPLVEKLPTHVTPLTIATTTSKASYAYLSDMVVMSNRLDSHVSLNSSDLVFVGYGIVAPEYNWNDYEGVNVQGKTVVILINDPGFLLKDASLFTGTAMTYYGRWTYKFEEARRQGAAAAIIIHQTEPATYPWSVVRNAWSGTQYGISTNKANNQLLIEGWIQEHTARDIFSCAGFDFDSLTNSALSRHFKAITLNAQVSVSCDTEFSFKECYNVIGYIKGTDYPDESIVYMAHWDHLGTVESEDGKEIYNGAVDNATGVAALFAIAETFMAELEPPKRSLVFLAFTAEESGLLGSKWYAEHPRFALEKTVAGINIDALNVYGETLDVISIGYGLTQLDSYIQTYAAKQKRIVVPHQNLERGYFFRSDHFSFAKKGVPVMYAQGGFNFIEKDTSYVRMVKQDNAQRYHTPQDIMHDLWDFRGMYQDLWLFFMIGKDLAHSNVFPEWEPFSEFNEIRKVSENVRKRK
jgi:Zn-dependent M28 family amino/carboxypeptidase